jgi:Tfp pilus assembly protein PilX
MRERLRNEDGIALVIALGMTVVLVIFVASMITYTTSGQRGANLSAADLQARQYAEAGLNTAYSMIVNQNMTTGGNPAAANLLGCDGFYGPTDKSGPSNCTTPSPKVVCLTSTSCTSGSAGSASVYGYWSGANPGSLNGTTVAASTWLLVSTGYARNPSTQATIAKTTTATVLISPLDSGAVASVWNHLFITAPLVPNVCQVDFGGNGVTITDPVYVIGNLCLTGQNASIQESTSTGQPVDIQVGGKLVLSGSGTKVGADSTHPITSGVVVGGCTTVSVASTTSTCSPSSFNYWVATTDTYVPNDAPVVQDTDIAADYQNFDPGPKHYCQEAGSSGISSTAFDNDTTQNGTNSTFELLPSTSYTCTSVNGSSFGQLKWNASTKQLTIAGSVFLDGNLTISQSATYTGVGVIETSGTITFNGNATQLCATVACNFTNWQGSSGNNSMLSLVSVKNSATTITFTNNSQIFQGSLFSQPSSRMTFVKNGVQIQGPISVGNFDASFNNASFKPLPVIKNMPVGAPVPPNTSASIGALTITK